jgi:FeS assembly SUF system protein
MFINWKTSAREVNNMVTQDDVMNALKQCYDPEIPVNIVDLGLIYDVDIQDKTVNVDMTLTARGCPMHSLIARDVKQKLQSLAGVETANVKVVWDPPWTPDRMSDEAKKKLGFT